MFKASFILLLIETNFILEKQDCKIDAFIAFQLNSFTIDFAFLAKIEPLYMQISKI